MASLRKKQFTKPLPPGAEIHVKGGQRYAKWTDGHGRKRTARVTEGRDGTPRLSLESAVWSVRYRDGAGIVREESTGCRDKGAAAAKMTEIMGQVERVKGGLLTATESQALPHAARPLSEHIEDHIAWMQGRRLHETTIGMRRHYLTAMLMDGCQFKRLSDLSRAACERWLSGQEGMSARTFNGFVRAASAFGVWLVREGRLSVSPFVAMRKMNEAAGAVRPRRAFTVEEVGRLLDAAERRPLDEACRINRGAHKGEMGANLAPATIERLKALGRERSLAYRALVSTGLRWGELRSITVGQVALDGPTPHIVLHAADEKNRKGAMVPLPQDLVDQLKTHLKGRSFNLGQRGASIVQFQRPGDAPLFDLPQKMTRTFNRDLAFAGIAKRDDRGRTVDIHSLRHTFATMLSKAGVGLAVAQRLMRHSTPSLTANTYTHLELVDTGAALASLPSFGTAHPASESVAVEAAAGRDTTAPQLAPVLAPTAVQTGHFVSHPDHEGENGKSEGENADLTKRPVNRGLCQRESTRGGDNEWWAVLDSNQWPPACKAGALTN
jgi:integrase